MKKSVYGTNFYNSERKTAQTASQVILPFIIEKLKCKSILDFGCGTGEWMLTAKMCEGVNKVVGVDGEYAREFINLEDDEFVVADLTKDVKFSEKFDLAISLEVAEHLDSEYAETFVHNLTQCADIILFSAAVPCQHGTNHVNEQYPSYWRSIFLKFDFEMCDCIRPEFWWNEEIEWYYRQNMFIYCRKEYKNAIEEKFGIGNVIDIIHPDVWRERNIVQYLFPFDLVNKDEAVCIYGGGVVGQTFINQVIQIDYTKKICWCDINAENLKKNHVMDTYGMTCVNPEDIDFEKIDKIILAILHQHIALDIKSSLIDAGINEDKIIWRNPKYYNEIT